MSNGRLLIAYAHPDDESFGLGALIDKYVSQRVEVSLICATNGDAGTVEPQYLEGYDSIADVRLAELACASEILRFTNVITFGYKDSGMMNSAANDDPECLWQAPQDEVTRRVVEVIRDIKPHVVITFDKFGGYGHPDHIAIQKATTEAVPLAGDPTFDTGQAPYTPQKFYYSSIPKMILRIAVGLLRLRGKNPRKIGANKDIDLVAILDYVEPTHTRVDISQHYEAWDKASACHASQGGGSSVSRMPRWARRILAPKQSFTRIYPAPPADVIDETDLFAGVEFQESAVAESV